MKRIVGLLLLFCFAPLVGLAGEASHAYRSIAERNAFRLRPPISPTTSPVPRIAESRGILFLTGVVSLFSRPQAFFMVEEPGKASSGFVLGEGEQNDWLQVISVDLKNRNVKARLNKPLMRLGTVGAEVVLSFETDDLKTAKRQLGPHVPSPGASQFLDGTL